MSLNPVVVQKGAVGANAALPPTSGSALLSNAPAIDDTLEADTVYKVNSLVEVEALGITPEYDVANDVVLHKHFKDFYKPFKGAGPAVWLMVTTAATPVLALDDASSLYAKKLIIEGDGQIWQLAIAWNIAAEDTETITDGFSALLRAAIPRAQAFADWAYSTGRPVHVLIEGRAASSTLTTLINLRNIIVSSVVLNAVNVSVIIGQDWDYAEARKTDDAVPEDSKVHLYAAVGKALGTLAAADINQSIGEVVSFNLSDATTGDFITAGLSNHLKVKDQEASLEALDGKGYIFAFYIQRTSGARWNNDHCCTPIIIDELGNINEHMIYYSRTNSYVSMLVKAHLTLIVKTRAQADASTGKLPKAILLNIQKSADQDVMEKLKGAGLISDGKHFLDGNSDLVTPPKTLYVSIKIVPTIILDNINAKINLVKSFLI